MPMSSPQMTRMLGLRPDGTGLAAGAAFGACARASEVSVAAATIDDVPKRRFLRSIDLSARDWLLFSNSLLIRYSLGNCTSFVFVLSGKRCPHHAAEADMTGRGVDRLGVARGGAIAAAIVRRTEMRAAFQDFARDADVWLTWIKARILMSAARIAWNATRLCRIRMVLRRPPVRGPLPDIADHVVQTV